ncbi:MAG: DNA-3-methyladenine glycosylase 2 family protein [Planctomycetaceae bacterium]|nr:DNA-3-methyladenine glycosylase 2 family protein [Planctomycetaceae bacterium]
MSFDPKVVRKAVTHLRTTDPIMRDVIDRLGPFQMKRSRRYFQSLTRAIVAQQISSKAALSIWGRLRESARPGSITAETIAQMSVEELRAVGISPQKASYLHDLAQHVQGGTLRLNRLSRHSDERVIEQLVAVKGIGVWTAQMFLMFSLGRLDVFPHGDLGIRTAIRDLYGLTELPDLKTCEPIVDPWRPYATVACWYLWRSTDEDDSW